MIQVFAASKTQLSLKSYRLVYFYSFCIFFSLSHRSISCVFETILKNNQKKVRVTSENSYD